MPNKPTVNYEVIGRDSKVVKAVEEKIAERFQKPQTDAFAHLIEHLRKNYTRRSLQPAIDQHEDLKLELRVANIKLEAAADIITQARKALQLVQALHDHRGWANNTSHVRLDAKAYEQVLEAIAVTTGGSN